MPVYSSWLDDILLHEEVLNYVQDLRHHDQPVPFNKLAAEVYATVAARTQRPKGDVKDEINRCWSSLRVFVESFGGDLRLVPSGSDLEVSLRTTGVDGRRACKYKVCKKVSCLFAHRPPPLSARGRQRATNDGNDIVTQKLERWEKAKRAGDFLTANRLREELRDLGVTPQMPRDGGHPPRASSQQQQPPPPQASMGPAACDERGNEEGRACCAAGHDARAGAAAFASQAVALAGASGECGAPHQEPSPSAIDKAIPSVSLQDRNYMQV